VSPSFLLWGERGRLRGGGGFFFPLAVKSGHDTNLIGVAGELDTNLIGVAGELDTNLIAGCRGDLKQGGKLGYRGDDDNA